ncbi:MAG: methylenetetrahydrofolate reductase [Alphaproteobacteria bacterium]|nr:methylenetetrahydrofolate reductase [Alphaproteobacteria bacterium]
MAPPISPPVGSALVRTLLAGEFAVTAEIVPPLSSDPASLIAKARPLLGLVDALNVTDGAGARSHLSSLVAAGLLVQEGHEPILQFTTRDRNRLALQSDVLGAGALGIRNILVLGGDDPKAGDQPNAKPVFDLDSGALIAMIREMGEPGRLPSGREIEAPPKLFIGAADTPIDPPAGWLPDRLASKADAGAQFVQTQFCYDIGIVRRYLARLGDAGLTDRMFILLGIGPIASARSARWMVENLWGVIISDAVIDRLEGAADEKAEGRKICIEFIEQVKEIGGVAGVHVMAINQDEAIAEILAAAQIGPAHRAAGMPLPSSMA